MAVALFAMAEASNFLVVVAIERTFVKLHRAHSRDPVAGSSPPPNSLLPYLTGYLLDVDRQAHF